jgi:hypothetical protein
MPGGLKRLPYYAAGQAYGGPAPANTPPVISNLTVSGATAGQPFILTAAVRDPQNDPVTDSVKVSGKYATGDQTLRDAAFTGPGSFRVTAPQQPGVWKVYLFAQDGKGERRHRDDAGPGRPAQRGRRRPGARPPRHRVVIPARPGGRQPHRR